MRLLITTDTVGGVWRFGIELIEGLLEAGDAVALVSFGQTPSSSQHTECRRLADRWKQRFRYVASETPLEWMHANDRSYDEGASLLRETVHRFDVDLLHSNQYCYGAVELGIPVLLTAHSDVLSWAQACGRALDDSEWLRRYCSLVQRGLDGAAFLTAPTEWMLRTLAANFDVPDQRKTIANGRSIPTVPRIQKSLRAVTAGRLWDEAKGISMLGSVQTGIPLIVAGSIDCDQSGGAPVSKVEHCGEVSQEDMLRIFDGSAIYICTSLYEPFGLAPLEAALCGCAVVARDIDSLREVWNGAALFFSNPVELSGILGALAADPIRLAEQQRKAKTQAQLYTRERMVAEYRELYTTVIAKEHACVG